jgi:putative transcriptional regulator
VKTEPEIRVALREILERRGRSAYWLSKQTGISQSVIWRIKSGKTRGMDFRTLALICAALECEPGDVLVFSEAKRLTKR